MMSRETAQTRKGARISLALDTLDVARLEEMAEQRGVSAAEVAGSILQLSLHALLGGSVHRQLKSLADQVELILREVTEIRALLAEPSANVADGVQSPIGQPSRHRSVQARHSVATSRLATGDGRSSRRQKRGSGSTLHDEIVRVLRQNKGAMGASEIAEAIRRSGRYKAPRSDRPVSGPMISSRVANPQYRGLFSHFNRKIALSTSAK